jgi:putative membrane protein
MEFQQMNDREKMTWKQAGGIFLRGSAMGAANIVPGVSGGTIALLTGIYARLIQAVRSLNREGLKLFFTGKWKKFWSHMDGTFLFALFCGIVFSILTLARGLSWILEHYPVLVWAFFFGLILASTAVVLRKVEKWTFWTVLALAAGTGAAVFVTILKPVRMPDNLFFVFLAGFISICAMILPGISGSFILVILGKYAFILGALNELNISVIAVFILGCITGLLAFSHLLGFILKKWWDISISVLAGFMAGSLNKVWPWKQTLEFYLDRHGELQPLIQKNVLPWNFRELTDGNPMIIAAASCFIFGLALVLVFEYFSARTKKKDPA